MSQLILQPFRLLHLRHSSFSNPTVALPTSQLILQPFFLFSYVTRAHSPTFPSLHLRNSSIFIPSVALPTSQFILQPFRCFTYVTAHSPTLLSLLLRHRLFTWRAAHGRRIIWFCSLWWTNDTRRRIWPKCCDICFTVEEKPWKNFN